MKIKQIPKLNKPQCFILGKGMILGIILSILFYNSIFGIILLLPYLPIYYKNEKKQLEQRKQEQLKQEFEQFIKLITKGLELGYSLEKCVEVSKQEYEQMIGMKKTPMICQLDTFLRKLQMNIPIQQIFDDFGKESKLEEIENFAQIIDTARKTGGNLPAILRRTSQVMLEKEQVYQEIITMMSAKRMEQKVMLWMPIGILAYMRLTSGSYMNSLYYNGIGIIIATLGLMFIWIAKIWAEKIISIKI